ncbi:lipid IV(A) 3-deoxy-D-manno-octulosonic acid transferase [Volucribacter amazonae]|uniref:3-deoxy-D-manno-octulosonic acid transferase n=1 Tax=Volucribacter amazonae TaxID=256731 RepID=A0A9X4PCS6_9PAST|nr:lipid IV(A) 3-deoxy-D-manno-octulosonic acid transferase [Volucribacter amazonae]MDG6894996.1 3-deoxy-D-manno-octulosonic acid transferase [Volucribacter amazonae]
MLRFLYTLLMYCIQPIIIFFMLIRSLKSPKYRQRLGERYGCYHHIQPPKPEGIIIHAASVGEVIAATPLVKRIQQQYPDLAITFTTVTPTGSDRVMSAFGQQVKHIYLPYDLPFVIKRFIDFVQPKLCIVIETEIWPNLIRQLRQRHIPFMIANARLSPRSAKRYGWVKTRFQNILKDIELIAAQDRISGERYLQLGYPDQRLKLTGNIKYDLTISPHLQDKINGLKTLWGDRLVWVAGSTHDGEDEIILQAHQQLLTQYPDLLLILVPRHPERFNVVAELVEKMGFNYCRRSKNILPNAKIQVVLGDTMGELMLLYGLADVAFVGGSLVKHGGHNPLEPLAFKCPIISGQYTFNFPEIFEQLSKEQGVLKVKSDVQSFKSAVDILLNSAEKRRQYGEAGFKVLMENRGALDRLLQLLQPYLER